MTKLSALLAGLGLNSSVSGDTHGNHYQHEPSVMMEPPGVHFDSNYSVLSTMDTQTPGMLQQNFDAHVSGYILTEARAHETRVPFWKSRVGTAREGCVCRSRYKSGGH